MIWLTRRVLPAAVFEMLFVALGIHLFSRSVFVARVIQNAGAAVEGHPIRLAEFLWSALWNSRVEVKMEIVIAAVFCGLFLWSVKRAVVSYEMLRRTAGIAKDAGKSSPDMPSAGV